MLQPDPDRPQWPVYVFFVVMLTVVFSLPSVMDSDHKIELASAPIGWLAVVIATMALGYATAIGAVTEYASWDDDERKAFWGEVAWLVVLLSVGTAVALVGGAWAGWTYRVLVYVMVGPWLVYKAVRWLSRPKRDVWD